MSERGDRKQSSTQVTSVNLNVKENVAKLERLQTVKEEKGNRFRFSVFLRTLVYDSGDGLQLL